MNELGCFYYTVVKHFGLMQSLIHAHFLLILFLNGILKIIISIRSRGGVMLLYERRFYKSGFN